jgi:hypothetical protein
MECLAMRILTFWQSKLANPPFIDDSHFPNLNCGEFLSSPWLIEDFPIQSSFTAETKFLKWRYPQIINFRRIFHKKNDPAIGVPPCHHDKTEISISRSLPRWILRGNPLPKFAQIRCWVSAHCSAAQANPNFLSVRTAKERASWLGGFP